MQTDKISLDDIKQVEKNFGPQQITNVDDYKGGKETLRLILQKSFGITVGSELFLKVLEQADDKSFSFLENVPTEKVLEITKNESPLIIALILSKLDPQKSSEILKKLSPEQMAEVIKHIAKQTEINNDTLDIIARKIKEKTNEVLHKDDGIIKISGKDKLIEILKHSDFESSQSIIDSLQADDPKLADEIKENIFTFNDIVTLKDSDLEFALQDYPNSEIAFMLKGTSEEIRKKFFSCISKHRAILIVDEMKLLGEVKKIDVVVRQHDFVNFLRDLQDEGKISLQEDNEEYVN